MRSVVGSNVHERGGGRVQQGGTSMLMYGTLIDQYDFEALGKDNRGFGRWVHMVLRDDNITKIRIACGYNPYQSNKKASGSSYQQQQ